MFISSFLAGMGICSSKCNLNRLPGKDSESFGLHNDGKFYEGSNQMKYTKPFEDTIVGCCINFEMKTIFFTIRGKALVHSIY